MLIPLDRERTTALDPIRASIWHGPLTIAEFCDRNERLREHRYGKRVEAWGWSVDGGKTLVSGCDLLPVSFVGKAGGTESGYLLASVATPPEHRGKRYASAMLEALLEKRGDKPWILFSDVGPEFYARWGFSPLPQVGRTARAEAGEVDLRSVGPEYVAKTLARLRKSGRLFEPEEVDWLAERYRAFAEFRDLIDVPVILDAGESDDRPVFLAVDPVRDHVALLWRVPGDEDALARARIAADVLGLSSVLYWEPVEGALGEGTKPEWPMVRDRDEKLAPVTDVQFLDWW